MSRALTLCLALLGAAPALAHEYLVGDLAIVHPHTRPTAPGMTVAGGFMELFNGSETPERLLAARSGVADLSFFDAAADGGAGARRATAIDLPPGHSVFLEPNSLQIRLADLEEPLRIGDRVAVTLVFEQAGPVTVEFWVEGTAAALPPEPAPESDVAAASSLAADEAAIATQLRATLGPDTGIAAIAVSGSAAVAGWVAGDEAGRAFLRRTGDSWRILLLSGPSLITAAGLRAQGISPRTANDLLARIETAEAALPATTLARLDSFAGTLILRHRNPP